MKKSKNWKLNLNKTTISKLNEKAASSIRGGKEPTRTCPDQCIDKTDFFDCGGTDPYTHFPYCS